jgi:hypothetical protein
MSSEETSGQLSGGTQFSESPKIYLGEEQYVAQESDGLEESSPGWMKNPVPRMKIPGRAKKPAALARLPA